MNKPNGIVLVTVPPAPAKPPTLYSALPNERHRDKIITTEDPVEYDIDGIIQCPIDSNIGVTFAACLRAILRKTPTLSWSAKFAISKRPKSPFRPRSPATWWFSTLHTNDAPSTVTRLRDWAFRRF